MRAEADSLREKEEQNMKGDKSVSQDWISAKYSGTRVLTCHEETPSLVTRQKKSGSVRPEEHDVSVLLQPFSFPFLCFPVT